MCKYYSWFNWTENVLLINNGIISIWGNDRSLDYFSNMKNNSYEMYAITTWNFFLLCSPKCNGVIHRDIDSLRSSFLESSVSSNLIINQIFEHRPLPTIICTIIWIYFLNVYVYLHPTSDWIFSKMQDMPSFCRSIQQGFCLQSVDFYERVHLSVHWWFLSEGRCCKYLHLQALFLRIMFNYLKPNNRDKS